MAVIYLRSTNATLDADNGSTWALAKTTLAAALTAAGAGGTVYVSNNHAETTAAGSITLTSPGTSASPVRVLCVDDSAEPPTALSAARTATVTTTGANSMFFGAGYAYVWGVIFSAATGSSARHITFEAASAGWQLEGCSLRLGATSASNRITIEAAFTTQNDFGVVLNNTTVQFADDDQSIHVRGALTWTNTASAVSGATIPLTLFLASTGGHAQAKIMGVDLSALGSGKSLVSVTAASSGRFEFVDCKLGASVSLTTGTHPSIVGTVVRMVNCDSGSGNTRFEEASYAGTITTETTIVRTSGATDGTTAVSRKMVSSANTEFEWPLKSDWIEFWNETTGSTVAVSIPVLTDNVTLDDDDAWLEVEYLGTSGFPLGNFAHDRAADILATPAAQTTDGTSTWTTTGLGTPVKETLSVSVTPQVKGVIRARVCLARVSTTMYFDPLAIAGARQFQTGGSYQNQPAAGGGGSASVFGR